MTDCNIWLGMRGRSTSPSRACKHPEESNAPHSAPRPSYRRQAAGPICAPRASLLLAASNGVAACLYSPRKIERRQTLDLRWTGRPRRHPTPSRASPRRPMGRFRRRPALVGRIINGTTLAATPGIATISMSWSSAGSGSRGGTQETKPCYSHDTLPPLV